MNIYWPDVWERIGYAMVMAVILAALGFTGFGMYVLITAEPAPPVNTPSAPATSNIRGEFQVTKVAVDGRQVTCITWKDWAGKAGGLSCDWTAK